MHMHSLIYTNQKLCFIVVLLNYTHETLTILVNNYTINFILSRTSSLFYIDDDLLKVLIPLIAIY